MEDLGLRFLRFCSLFTSYFRHSNRPVDGHAQQYICGLMQATRKNMERMAEVVPDANAQALQHFLSNSRWDFRAVLAQVARIADQLIGGSPETGLLIDETAFTKKGEKSVGVARQYSGRLGKVDNCQVAVFATLVRGFLSTLISVRLFLPKAWVENPQRCREAKIPEPEIVAKNKTELGLEMVHEARQNGVRFSWVGADAGYGKEPAFLRALDEEGEIFVVDVHCDQRVYLEDPAPYVPEKPPGRGRRPSRLVTQSQLVRVDEWADRQPEEAWTQHMLRHSTKGEIHVQALERDVWIWDGREASARRWRLVVTRGIESGRRKYSLSNAPQSIAPERLVNYQRQRFWIERSFEDGKSEAGLGDYQVRGWLGWHHHMALVMVAMLFMLGERLHQKPTRPLLSCSDIETLLAHFLPQREPTLDEILRQLRDRHRVRWAGIQSAYRCRGHSPPTLQEWTIAG